MLNDVKTHYIKLENPTIFLHIPYMSLTSHKLILMISQVKNCPISPWPNISHQAGLVEKCLVKIPDLIEPVFIERVRFELFVS